MAAERSAEFYGTREGFLEVYEQLRDELIADVRDHYKMPAEAVEWQRNVRAERRRRRRAGGGVARAPRAAGAAAAARRRRGGGRARPADRHPAACSRAPGRAARRASHPLSRAPPSPQLIEYSVPGGKLNRGLTVVHTLAAIRGPALTPADAKAAAVLGWCIEWLQAFFLVADDVMDASVTRRGAPCWYKLPAVGLIAINDSFLLNAHLFRILKRHFAGSPAYGTLLEMFNATTFETELGQLLDLTSAPAPGSSAPTDYGRYTLERYNLIVKYKTAFYSFVLPVACGLVLGGHADAAAAPAVRDILLLMGEYFQVQDDVLDAFADPSVLGKVGTDIPDNKCGWLVVQALAAATPAQRATIEAHYGKHGAPESEAIIKALYVEMGLQAKFDAYEADSYARLQAMIADVTANTTVPPAVFNALLAKIYKRKM